MILTFKKAAVLLNDFEVPDSSIFNVTREFIPILRILPTFGWIIGLGLLGIGLCLTRYDQSQLPLGFAAAHALSVLMTYNFGRFRVGLVPLLMLFAAHGVVWIIDGLLQSRSNHRRRPVFCLCASASISAIALLPPIDYDQLPFARADRELRDLVRENIALDAECRELKTKLVHASEDVRLRARLSEVLLKMNRPAESIVQCQHVLRLTPQDAMAHLSLSRALKAAGQTIQAIQSLRESIVCDQELSVAHEELGQLLLSSGQFSGAVAELEQAVRLEPNRSVYQMWLGISYMQTGKLEQAERTLQTAIKVDPEDGLAHYYLGSLYQKLGRNEEAIDQILQAVKIKPQFPQAFQLLLRLRDPNSPLVH